MLAFKLAVMDFADSAWMMEALESFNPWFLDVANSHGLRRSATICLTEDKTRRQIDPVSVRAVMLSSMRSLFPKDLNEDFEVAWN